jgi:Ankyrin repeats (many copies)
MGGLDPAFRDLIEAIVADDKPLVATLLRRNPELAVARATVGATRTDAEQYYYRAIEHYLYAGDTGSHMAAAGYRVPICRELLNRGADVAARNRRGAQPLHYAADGIPGSHAWNPAAQGATVTVLVEAGADPNATDRNGVAPLHRAIRTRSAAAVAALLAGGADPRLPNLKGSTPLELAQWTTGRGGSGSPAAKAEQEAIIRLLERHGAGG